MLFNNIISFLVLFVGWSVAEVDPVLAAIDGISNSTMGLTGTILSWTGLADTLDLQLANQKLLDSVKTGIETALDSNNLTIPDAIKLKVPADDLVAQANTTLFSLMYSQDKFALLGPLIWLQLRVQRKVAADFTDAVLKIVPESYTDAIAELGQKVDSAIEDAINAYKPF